MTHTYSILLCDIQQLCKTGSDFSADAPKRGNIKVNEDVRLCYITTQSAYREGRCRWIDKTLDWGDNLRSTPMIGIRRQRKQSI